jgi:Xaa-Pro aminopeptidase
MPDLSIEELELRWKNLRLQINTMVPEAGGAIIFSRMNIYHLTGTFGSGLFWLPLDGDPVLLCRRGLKRAREESPISNIIPFKSYREAAALLGDAGSSLTSTFAAEMNGLSWALADLFKKHMKGYRIVNADSAISEARSIKTPYELKLIRDAGARHAHCLNNHLPSLIAPGMTEMEMARVLSDLLFEHGHHGILRMEKFGEEVYMGHISCGDSANYSSVFNGALGLKGLHPSVPHMGSSKKRWEVGEALMIDIGFSLEGYQTDKSHVYWPGNKDGIPSNALRAHELCLDMQQWIAENLKPEILPSYLWEHCFHWAEREGLSDGFMGLTENKVSFVGHGIGLAVDEYPVLARGFDQPLKEGMVIAVEPKIGIMGIGMVGIENTFEVTPAGGICLTGDSFEITCI